MKTPLARSLLIVLPVLATAVSAQTAPPAAKPAAKPPAKAAAKAEGTVPTKSGARLARSAAKAVEEVTPIDDDPSVTLNEAELEVAKRVYLGHIPCELGATVEIRPSKREGFFVVQVKNMRYNMHPVESRTGAIRLEDARRGGLWIQLGNKSMLMSQKLGLRLADECQSPEQITYADEIKKNPPRSLLDAAAPPQGAASAAAVPARAASASDAPAGQPASR